MVSCLILFKLVISLNINIGKWLQIRFEKEFLDTVVESLKDFDAETAQLPRIFDFPEKNLRFIVNHLTPTNMIH